MTTSSTFYNTTNLDGALLQKAKASANNQKDFVLTLFETYELLAPSQAYHFAQSAGIGCTINGIRAAFTFLTQEGALLKTDQKINGLHGRPEHLWKVYVPLDGEQIDLF